MKTLIIFSFFYNRAREVSRSVKSLLDSAPADAEIILVNDGSIDGTYKELQRFQCDERVKLIDQDNHGFSNSLASIIPEFLNNNNYKYLAIHGAGDLCETDKFKKQISFLEEHDDVVAVGCGHRLISADTGKELLRLTGEAEADSISLYNTVPFTHGSVVYRSSAFIAAGGYDRLFKCCQDWELYFRLLEYGRVIRLDALLYNKFLFQDGVSFKPAKKLEQLKYIEIIREGRKSKESFNELRGKLEAYGIDAVALDKSLIAKCRRNQYSLIAKGEFRLAREWCLYLNDGFGGKVHQWFIKILLNIAIIMTFPRLIVSASKKCFMKNSS